ncbi:gp58-like family protein [Streptococcus suis]|uniref:phage tail protein n=1 Tax=Streptococcus suis TaxID=1307 RepID=UPI0037D7D0D9
MLTFLDHKGNEIGALTTFKYINSVNGERSLSGTVHGNLEIEKGWGVRFEDEYYKVIYAKPKSLGKINIVQFDAVHQFFWDFDKSSVYSELDGSYPFQTFLDHIFNGSGYRYKLEVEVGSLRKQNFGLKKRLELFNDLIKHAGVEFQVRGKVVRILERTGTDLSTVVRKKLNLNDLSIEKRIGDFITYQKGLGAWHDENDHSKGRLEVEYVSPLVTIYGRLEGEPYVDERFTISENFLEVLKKTVEDSYSISVQLTMEDLHKAGYRYTRPLAGDYITVIDEEINFKERVRIVSFETEYDIKGQVIDHTVTCNDIGSVKKQSVGYSSLKSSVADVSKETESAIKTANRALVSADGKSTVYFGTEFPQDVPKGTLTKGDTLYLKVGDKTKMYYWNGAEWLEPPVVNDVEVFKESINTEIAQVNASMQAQSEEHDRQVADILSKTHSVESLANQAKSDAASAITRANQVKTEAIADARAQIATVNQALNTAKSELQTAIANADQKARDSQASATALRNDLNSQANKILAQAQAQTALTNRVTTVETLADGTKTTVAELSKTVTKATGDIASVSSRTKTVEDTLSQTRTQYEALSQTVNAQTGQIDSINRKTADLQSGIDGVTERFENLQVGGENLLLNAGFEDAKDRSETFAVGGVVYTNKLMPKWGSLYNSGISNPTTAYHAIYRESFNGKGPVIEFNESNGQRNWKGINAILRAEDFVAGNYMFSADVYATGPGTKIWFGFYYYNKRGSRSFHDGQTTVNITTTNSWHRVAGQIKLSDDIDTTKLMYLYIYAYNFESNSILYLTKPKLEEGTVATAFSLAQETIRSEIASYKRTAEESSAELSRQIQTVDGKAVDAKNYAQQTAEGFKTRIESLETYKNAEGTRASQYFTASRDETARQVTALRTAVTDGYVAKAKYEEDARGVTQRFESLQVGGRNYIRNFGFTDSSYTLNNNNSQWRYERIADPTSRSGYHIKATCTQAGSGGFHRPFVDLRGAHWQGRTMTYAVDVKCSRAVTIGIGAEAIESGIKNQSVSTEWQRFAVTGKVKHISTWSFVFYIRNTQWQVGDVVYIRDPQLEDGTMATTPSPAPEDQQSYADTKISEYQNTVDGRFATLQSQKANQVDFQAVKETAQLYERIIGSTEIGIKDKVARMVMADSLFLTEVKDKISGTATQVSQLNNSYAIKNLTSAGTVLNQINLLANGTNRIDGRLTHITGQTLIDNGVIKTAMIGNLDAGKITTGYLASTRIATNSIDGSKLVFDQAFVNKMTANKALFKQLFAQSAFITSVQAVTLSASQITGGLMRATNGAMEVNLNSGQILHYTDQAALKRILDGYPTQFVKFATGTVAGKGTAGVTVIGSNRRDSESSNDGGFVGIRAWNGSNIDQIDVVGDTVRLASSTFESADGWTVNTLPGKLDIDAFNADHRASSKIKVGDLWLWKNATTYSSMRDTINLIIDNLQLLHSNKSTERAYSYTLPAKV